MLGPVFYGNLVYKFRQIVGKSGFVDRFRGIVGHLLRHKAGQEGRGEILLENSFMR